MLSLGDLDSSDLLVENLDRDLIAVLSTDFVGDVESEVVVSTTRLGIDLLDCIALPLNGELVPVDVVVLPIKVENSVAVFGGRIISELSPEVSCVGVKLHVGKYTLSIGKVRAGKSLDLEVLERAILVPEALAAGTS